MILLLLSGWAVSGVMMGGCGVIFVLVGGSRSEDSSAESIFLLVVRSEWLCNGDPGCLVGGDGIKFAENIVNFVPLSDVTCVDVAVTSTVGEVTLQWDVVE